MDHKENDREPTKVVDLTATTSLISNLADAVCDHMNTDPLDPEFSLYDYIDTDALAALVESVSTGLHLQFTIEDVEVRIWKPDPDAVNIYVSDRL